MKSWLELLKEEIFVKVLELRLVLQLLGVEVSDIVKDLLKEQMRWLRFVYQNQPEIDAVNQVLVLIFNLETSEKRLNRSDHVSENTDAKHFDQERIDHLTFGFRSNVAISDRGETRDDPINRGYIQA